MAAAFDRFRESRSWWFDLDLCAAAWHPGFRFLAPRTSCPTTGEYTLIALVGVPLIVVVARFPMVLDDGEARHRGGLRLERS